MIIRLCLFAIFILSAILPGNGQQKITRYILQKDYIDYGNDMFRKTMTDLYRDVLSGDIPGYTDATLKNYYSKDGLTKRTLQCEKVKKQEPGKTDEDTLVCLPLDYDAATFWLEEVPKSGLDNFFPLTDIPLAFYTDSANRSKLLFYINYKDFERLDSTEKWFLIGYIEDTYSIRPGGKPLVMNQNNVRKYVTERFSSMVNGLNKRVPSSIPPKLYVSDSLNVQFTTETFQKKKEWFLSYGQNFDTEKTVSIMITEYLGRSGDGYTLKESSIGLGGEIRLGSSSLSDIPLYYMSYNDANMIFMMFASSSRDIRPFAFLKQVSGYQLYNSISDMSWH